ncbi:DUF302 domain-containing protein [Tepidibacillus sp. HK-1]|uniref:DUF302 domain-containing protein n=1 Tax=Tepidibacillus sp. HK-1 TaxID=1883407 RepID=UPI000852EAB7|nr:DUF302 domain-containing protein [Tepidibacillus sp. HK-1]GBF10963.1 hypothetical protein HK1_00980 [Tepidibacillus sp. HK-1]
MKHFEYVVPSNKGFEQTIEAIDAELKKIAFKIVARIDIHNNILNKGYDFKKKVSVLEVCNAGEAYEILSLGNEVSIFLPCKITVTEEDGIVNIRMPRPTFLLNQYEKEEWNKTADHVESLMINVMDEAAK